MGCWSPHTSHLPTLALGTWPLLLLVGTEPSWPSNSRPGSRELPLSIAPIHLDTHLWPLGPFWNLGVPPQGSEWLAGLRGDSSSVRRAPPWDACKPGPPKSHGARWTSQEDSQTGPSKPSPNTSKVRPDPGRSRGRLRVSGSQSVGPAQGDRQEQGPEWLARPGSGPQGAGEGRCGVTLSRLITYTYSF